MHVFATFCLPKACNRKKKSKAGCKEAGKKDYIVRLQMNKVPMIFGRKAKKQILVQKGHWTSYVICSWVSGMAGPRRRWLNPVVAGWADQKWDNLVIWLPSVEEVRN